MPINPRFTRILKIGSPQALDCAPMVVGETSVIALDFFNWTGAANINSASATVANVPAGGSAVLTISGSCSSGEIPIAEGGTGQAGSGIMTTVVANAVGIARLTVTVLTTDGQTLIGYVHVPVQAFT
jgi:hypothetical protein